MIGLGDGGNRKDGVFESKGRNEAAAFVNCIPLPS